MKDSQPSEEPLGHAIGQMLDRFRQSELGRLEQAKKTLRNAVLPTLREAHIANIEAAYSGYGDSGAIDGIQFRDSAGVRVDRGSLPTPLIEQLENLLYQFLPSGFEINDGGQGTLTLDVQTAKVTLHHQENYTETRDSTREFDL